MVYSKTFDCKSPSVYSTINEAANVGLPWPNSVALIAPLKAFHQTRQNHCSISANYRSKSGHQRLMASLLSISCLWPRFWTGSRGRSVTSVLCCPPCILFCGKGRRAGSPWAWRTWSLQNRSRRFTAKQSWSSTQIRWDGQRLVDWKWGYLTVCMKGEKTRCLCSTKVALY